MELDCCDVVGGGTDDGGGSVDVGDGEVVSVDGGGADEVGLVDFDIVVSFSEPDSSGEDEKGLARDGFDVDFGLMNCRVLFVSVYQRPVGAG